MYVEQLYTQCLAEAAYYIESNGEAAVVDPLRDPAPYIEMASKRGAKIKYVFETHFHADFVSGHIDLAHKTGATIVYGPTAQAGYNIHVARDGEVFLLGDISIKVLHTPGHTMESSSYLLIDRHGNDHCLFSGDTLFIGDVGRPDLAVKSDLTREDLAGHLFDSLRNKIMPLSDDVIIYPNHGAGSACGKMMSEETYDTLGHQKKVNYALRPSMSREEFVKEVTEGLVAPPQYFPKNAVMNKTGYEPFDEIMMQGNRGLDIETFCQYRDEESVLVIDTRMNEEVVQGFIPNSVFLGIDDNFAPWLGALIEDLKQPLLFIAEAGREEEVVMRAARVGYDNVLGYLVGGIDTWKSAGKELDTIESWTAAEFAEKLPSDGVILDVRKESEFTSRHIKGAVNFPLDFINSTMDRLDPNETYYMHCEGGYRSVITGSILRRNGFKKLVNILGGMEAIYETNIPLTDFAAPTTML